jgi:hypothetical protein
MTLGVPIGPSAAGPQSHDIVRAPKLQIFAQQLSTLSMITFLDSKPMRMKKHQAATLQMVKTMSAKFRRVAQLQQLEV